MKEQFFLFSKKAMVVTMLFSFSLLGSSFSFHSTDNTETPPSDDKVKSLAAFQTILSVLKHPRCINCHPSDDRPRQGDDQHIHKLGVVRGNDNHGGSIQKCQTCHHAENNQYSNVPGAPHWGLAPKSMGWFGQTDIEIARRLLDPKMNGGRSALDIAKHMTEDALVLWAWQPGQGRELPPVDFETWKNTVEEWLATGAYTPSE